MSKPDYLTWENFRSTVFVRGEKGIHRITEKPLVEIFGDGEKNLIGIWIEVPQGTLVPQDLAALELITPRIVSQDGRHLLEVTTPAASLHRQFYHFAVAVAERVLVEKRPATEAVGLELRCFTDLLEARSILGIERQIGLIGELLFLEHLMNKKGVNALDSWHGPGEPHDFRLGKSEFEVKTTVATRRIHTIHGAEQLVPSKGCSLYLLSVLLGPAGAGGGFSLTDKVAQLSGRISADPAQLAQFESVLEASGFRKTDSSHYTRKFALRRPMGVVPVDEAFPAITRPGIQKLLGPLAPRIDALQYGVNVEGLEHEEDTIVFETVLS